MSQMMFGDEFPYLSRFLGAWFPDSDYESASDREIVAKYVKASSDQEVAASLSEAKRLLADPDIPYLMIGLEANRHFEDEADSRDWLDSIIQHLQDELSADRGQPPT